MDLGIVNRVVAPLELETAARAWAEQLATKPTKVLGLVQEAAP